LPINLKKLKMPHTNKISASLYEQLLQVEPSRDWGIEYKPCLVTLKDGRKLDCVYVVPEQPYIKIWGVFPEDDSGKESVQIEDVSEIEESPSRLPAKIANKIYDAGESGMGYCVFTLIFNDGSTQAYITGNAVDFVPLPAGKAARDIEDVLTQEGRQAKNQGHGLKYYWCIYSDVEESA
jgi:hypothetical protein